VNAYPGTMDILCATNFIKREQITGGNFMRDQEVLQADQVKFVLWEMLNYCKV
jgi:hypothetical protein